MHSLTVTRGFYHNAQNSDSVMQRNALHHIFHSKRHRKLVMQELVTASSVPPSFRKQYNSFSHVHKLWRRASELRCGGLWNLYSDGNHAVANVLWTCLMQIHRKFRSDNVHVAPLETAGIFTVEMIPYCGPKSHGTRGRLARVRWGPWSKGRPCYLSVSLCW